ncbi:MAG TPA: hypothetical protein VGV67_02250, partial [Solirubrobacteraceae bacterium]|nr:hypothetical protein [Solirubrobacteraceae bacterium]
SRLSWTTSGARPQIVRWVVYLDGRRVRTLKATARQASQTLRHRVRVAGRHRWRVEGRGPDGRRVVSGALAFRVLRAT